MHYIRFSIIPLEYLKKVVFHEPLMGGYYDVTTLLDQAGLFQDMRPPARTDYMYDPAYYPRVTYCEFTLIYSTRCRCKNPRTC